MTVEAQIRSLEIQIEALKELAMDSVDAGAYRQDIAELRNEIKRLKGER